MWHRSHGQLGTVAGVFKPPAPAVVQLRMSHPHSGVVNHFWELAELDEAKRVAATSQLLKYLVEAQKVLRSKPIVLI